VFASPHSHSSAEDISRLATPDEAVFGCCLVIFLGYFADTSPTEQL
jgi:hypothetical protein